MPHSWIHAFIKSNTRDHGIPLKPESNNCPKRQSPSSRITTVKQPRAIRVHRHLPVLSLVVALTGCEAWRFATPTDNLAIRTPGTWSAASQGRENKVSTGWLREFNDPDMSRVVLEALEHNRDLKAASARLRGIREDSLIARAGQLPSAAASAGGSVTDGPDTNRRQAHTIGFAASWEIDLWGRLRDITRTANAEERAAIEDFRGARLSLAANTAKAWCDLITAEQQVALARQTLASFETNLRIIERNYKGTGEGALDIQFGRTNVSAAKRTLESQSLDREEAARSLELLLGRYPAGSFRPGANLPTLSSRVPAGLPADLLDRRPDLSADRARLFASARRADAARKALLPAFALTAAGGTSTTRLGQMLDLDTLVATLAGRLTQSLTEGGALSAEARQTLALNEENLHRYAQSALTAFREVESGLATDRSLSAQENQLAAELTQASLAERLAQRDYTEGINPNILSVLEAQRRANNARSSMIRLKNARIRNRIDLHLALGGDFETKPAD
jgi:multidrug efflux system outer membrane protein